MSLSRRSLDTLIDLIEIKLSCMEVWDRDDARELQNLQIARQELLALAGRAKPVVAEVVELARRGRGRPRAVAV